MESMDWPQFWAGPPESRAATRHFPGSTAKTLITPKDGPNLAKCPRSPGVCANGVRNMASISRD